MFDRLDDTIVAISSPPGIGARGVTRLSGPDALVLAEALFAPDDGPILTQARGHRRIRGRVQVGTDGSVPAEAYTFRGPASYTRQDVVELHTIGSPPVLATLLEQLTHSGARVAEPGEFTARAFFLGAMDLTRVEGVAAMINARSDSQLRASEALLHGKLSKRSTALREQLADLLALIEAEIDFVEEPIEFVSREQVIATVDRAASDLASLLRDAVSEERLQVLPEVILVGPHNTGKSTLFNRLTGVDRAIASATAGTTRDVLRAPASVPGGEVMLLDSPGLAPAPDAAGGVELAVLEQLAGAATERSTRSADLILLTVDVTNAPGEAVEQLRSMLPARRSLVVLNKIDQLPEGQLSDLRTDLADRADLFLVAALTGDGVEALRAAIGRMLISAAESPGSDILALSDRQRGTLRDAKEALLRAGRLCTDCSGLAGGMELVALEIREALDALSLLLGAVAPEELLARIFSRFCIGK